MSFVCGYNAKSGPVALIMSNKSKSYFSTITSLTTLSLLAYGLVYVLELWIAQLLGPAAYGNVKIKIRIIHNLVHVLLLGQDGILLIYLERYREDPERLKQFITWLIRSVGLRIAIIWLCCALTYLLHRWGYPGLSVDWAIWLSVTPFVLVLSLVDRWFLALKKYYQSFLPRNIFHPILCALGLWCIPKGTETWVLMVYGGGMALACCQPLYAIYPYTQYTTTIDRSACAEWWRSARYYLSSVLVIQTSRSFNLYLLDYFGYDPKEVGYFAAMLTIALALYTFTRPTENFIKPWISSHHRDPASLRRIMCQCNRIRWFQVALVWGVVCVYADTLMGQFGPEYLHYAPALRWLISCYSFYAVGQLNLDLLNFGGHPHLSSAIMLGKFLVMSCAAIVLIPTYGLWGCLIADGGTSVLAIVVASFLARRHVGMHGWHLI